MRIVGTAPNQSNECSGVRFFPVPGYGMVSEDLPPEMAQGFLDIPTFKVYDGPALAYADGTESPQLVVAGKVPPPPPVVEHLAPPAGTTPVDSGDGSEDGQEGGEQDGQSGSSEDGSGDGQEGANPDPAKETGKSKSKGSKKGK